MNNKDTSKYLDEVISKVDAIALIYERSEDYLHTNIDMHDGDISYNNGFKAAIEGFRNYLRQEIVDYNNNDDDKIFPD